MKIQTHKTLKHFEKAVRKRNHCPDYVKVDGIIYTMDNYDMDGKELSYGNKKTFKGFVVETEDRYNKGYADSKIYETGGVIRNDITYYN